MNIQIFGKSKCFDTKKAERYFKERGIKYQSIDMVKFGISKGEFQNVLQAIGSIEAMIDANSKEKEMLVLIRHFSPEDQVEKLLEHPKLFQTPIVRNGKKATIGFCPDVWKDWG